MSAFASCLLQPARFFWWFSTTASLAPTNPQCSCEADNFGPAICRHARSGLGARFDPIESGVFEAKLQGAITAALCWAHARRQFFELADIAAKARRGKNAAAISPVGLAAVKRIDALFDIERDINMPAHRIKLPVGIEEADDAFRLLERLNQTVQQDAIEATVLPSNAALVVFAKGVHEQPPADPRQPDSAAHSPPFRQGPNTAKWRSADQAAENRNCVAERCSPEPAASRAT